MTRLSLVVQEESGDILGARRIIGRLTIEQLQSVFTAQKEKLARNPESLAHHLMQAIDVANHLRGPIA